MSGQGVSVSPQAVVQALHQTYGQTVGQLHQRVAELSAANAALEEERDAYREAAQRPLAGVFRQEGQPDQAVALTDVTDQLAPDHGQPYIPEGFQGDPRWPDSEPATVLKGTIAGD